MKIKKFYFLLLLMNFLPPILRVLYLLKDGRQVFGEELLYFMYAIPLSLIAAFFNLSFFFLKEKSIKNNKVKSFLSYYMSSIFFFVISNLILIGLILFDNDSLKICLLNSSPVYYHFFINFIFVFFYKRSFQNKMAMKSAQVGTEN